MVIRILLVIFVRQVLLLQYSKAFSPPKNIKPLLIYKIGDTVYVCMFLSTINTDIGLKSTKATRCFVANHFITSRSG